MITSLPDTVDDGIGTMSRDLPTEFVTVPESYLRQCCEASISRLDALTTGSLQDYLKFCSESWMSYPETIRRGHHIFHDIGRFEGFPDRNVRERKVMSIIEAVSDLKLSTHQTVGRIHGLQSQVVEYVRKIGHDGILFRLTALPF